MITTPFNTTDFFFTLDDANVIDVSSENATSYFTVKVTITYFSFYDNVALEQELNYKLSLFKGAQSEVIGRKIHRYLAKQKVFNNTFGFIQKTATADFEIKEIESDDNSVLDTVTLENIKFIPGHKPKLQNENLAILAINSNKERVTKHGIFLVNLLLPEGTYQLKLFKNDVEVDRESITATATDNVFSKKIIVKDYAGAKGDVFTINIADGLLVKSFVVFPDNKTSKQMLFIGSNNLLSSLECTGSFAFSTDYKQIKQEYYRNFKEVLEVVATQKTNKFIINTGWLLKTDVTIIDEVLDSGFALLIENDATVLELVPIAKKITGEDSEKFLYEYNLEFQINKTNA